ncbi:hypothetical protein QG516_13135 [Pedobacter gandavensis]|uniref:hypothetical protein n=1 Tax=Pedobacter gandavensis TaxID=2679963 RepID=UPI0024785F9C|nr:hypothetical protein [Pedobacter gandavensis]WGQ07511.1 hypothetical protein QG516_13135 [Pedobacter gandavensis]
MEIVKNINIIQGGRHEDLRGVLTYFNQFCFDEIKRFYFIQQPNVDTVRAWQGHKVEEKWFHVVSGAFKIILVKPDDWDNPSENLPFHEFNISSDENHILFVPGGYASGFHSTIPNSKLMVFSNSSVEESIKDDYRFNKDLWFKW